MTIVFLMMEGGRIISVDVVDLETRELTIEKAAWGLAEEIRRDTGRKATNYAVLGDTSTGIWLLQEVTELEWEDDLEDEYED